MPDSLRDKVNNFKRSLRNKLKHRKDNSLFVKLIDELQLVGSVESPNEILYIWSGTQAEYDALEKVRDDTLYFIE